MEMSFEDIIKFLDSLIVPIIVGILSAGLTIYIKNKEIKSQYSGNTMTENGGVNRGVCQITEGLLTSVVECKDIAYDDAHEIAYKDENGTVHILDYNTPVSMNMWGFTPDYFDFATREFSAFLSEKIDVPKSEQVIPDVADALIKSGEATFKVVRSDIRRRPSESRREIRRTT